MRFRILGAMLGLWLGMGMASSAQAAWYQVKSRHFIVYSDGNPQQLELFATKLEKFDYLLRRITNAPEAQRSTNPVRVFLLANRSQVRDLAHNPNVGGFYTTSDRFGLAILSRETKDHKFDLGAEEILFHEYTHHFMLENFPAAYPAWYVEGFAEFFSVITFQRDGGIQFGQVPLVRAPTLVNLSIYPLEQLFSRDTEGLSLQKGDQFYGTAWLVTHYFHYDEKRRVEFRRYLDDLTSGKRISPSAIILRVGCPRWKKTCAPICATVSARRS